MSSRDDCKNSQQGSLCTCTSCLSLRLSGPMTLSNSRRSSDSSVAPSPPATTVAARGRSSSSATFVGRSRVSTSTSGSTIAPQAAPRAAPQQQHQQQHHGISPRQSSRRRSARTPRSARPPARRPSPRRCSPPRSARPAGYSSQTADIQRYFRVSSRDDLRDSHTRRLLERGIRVCLCVYLGADHAAARDNEERRRVVAHLALAKDHRAGSQLQAGAPSAA